jgi:hypothetical protein
MPLTPDRLEQKLLESTDEFGDTPIIKACRRGHIEVTSFLLEQGANIDARNEDGYTALMLACYWEQLEVVDLLLRHGADAGLTSNNGVFLPRPPVGALCRLTVRALLGRWACRPHVLRYGAYRQGEIPVRTWVGTAWRAAQLGTKDLAPAARGCALAVCSCGSRARVGAYGLALHAGAGDTPSVWRHHRAPRPHFRRRVQHWTQVERSGI